MKNAHVFATFVTLAVSVGHVAQAACFDTRDMGRGVTVEMSNGDAITMQRIGSGDIVVTEKYYDDPVPVRFTGAYGLYFTEEVEIADGVPNAPSRLEIVFDRTSGPLPAPQAGVEWQGNTTNVFSDGGTRDEDFSVKYTQGEPQELSDCRYDVLNADIRYVWPSENDSLTLRYAYLPDLGAAFLLYSQSGKDDAVPNVPVAIVAASKTR